MFIGSDPGSYYPRFLCRNIFGIKYKSLYLVIGRTLDKNNQFLCALSGFLFCKILIFVKQIWQSRFIFLCDQTSSSISLSLYFLLNLYLPFLLYLSLSFYIFLYLFYLSLSFLYLSLSFLLYLSLSLFLSFFIFVFVFLSLF